jgi:hypothetical protein
VNESSHLRISGPDEVKWDLANELSRIRDNLPYGTIPRWIERYSMAHVDTQTHGIDHGMR